MQNARSVQLTKTRAFPANAHQVAAIAVESVSVSETSKSIIDDKQHRPPKIIAPPSKIRRPNRSKV